MSGHSKWSSIKHKKAATDQKRAKVFTRLLKEITVAARMGGGDPTANSRLRNAVQEAKANNVPNDNIERAIKKGTGELEGATLEEINYEGYGPSGVAVLLETVTDNRNRTVSEIRHLFSKHGGNLGENGCVAWMFDQRGVFVLGRAGLDEEQLVELAVELEADDFATDDDAFVVYTAPERYSSVLEALESRDDIELEHHQLAMVPQNQAEVDADKMPQLLRLVEALEDHDDVQHVWTNFDATEEELAAVGS